MAKTPPPPKASDERGVLQDSTLTRSTYTPAEAAADLAHYQRLKRSVSAKSLLVVVLSALILAHWSLWFALALLVGGICGVGNALLAMHGNERLLDRRSVGAFVISSFVRIGLFGIVPVVLVIESGSLWSLGLYFTGFFTPLGLYAAGLRARW